MKSFKLFVTRRLRLMIASRFGVQFQEGVVKFHPGVLCEFEPPCRVSGAVDFAYPQRIGAFTYFDAQEDGARKLVRNLSIGRYCSVAVDSHVGLIAHPLSWLSSAPVVYSGDDPWRNDYAGNLQSLAVFDAPRELTAIGNDVWIGSGADVKCGVKIGDGAVVGAGAMVAKDVPPYAIVGGVPAKVIRYRFDEATIKRLLATKWWDYDLSSFGPIEFSDIHKALDVIEAAIREGRARPYARRKVTAADLYPYARRCLFHFSCRDGWLCVKAFGLWLVHVKSKQGV